MEVEQTFPQPRPGHSIEIGRATWNENQRSIRNRYDLEDGHFNRTASSELPRNDIEPIMQVVARTDFLDVEVCRRIVEALQASIERRAIN